MRQLLKKVIVSILNYKAKKVLALYRPNIFLVTGAQNRNVYKDAIVENLKAKGESVRVSAPGMNYKLGIPLTVLNEEAGFTSVWRWISLVFKNYSKNNLEKNLVLEFVYSRVNDYQYILDLNPKAIIVTDLSPVKGYSSLNDQQVIDEYKKLIDKKFEATKLFIPKDVSLQLSNIQIDKTLSFGGSETADIALLETQENKQSQAFKYRFEGNTYTGQVSKFGVHNAYSRILSEIILNSK